MKSKNKYLLLCVVLFINIALFTSCNQTIKDDWTVNDDICSVTANDYIYSVWNDVMLKYNVKTGTVTTVCDDPLCHHNSSKCQFFHVNPTICVVGNMMYYCKYENDDTAAIWSYDMAKGVSTKLYSNADIDEFYFIDTYLYFWNRKYISEEKHFYAELIRYDLNKNKGESLAIKPVEERSYYLYHDENKIYWYNDMGDEFSTNRDYQEVEKTYFGGRMESGCIYLLDRNFTSIKSYHEANSRSLYRKNMQSSVIELLCDDLDNYVIVDNQIVYITSVSEPEIVYQSPIDEFDVYYNHYEGCVKIMDLDGDNKRNLCDGLDCNIYRLSVASSGNSTVVGEYVVFLLYDFLEDGTYGISPNLLIVNSKTGEYKITEYAG